MGHGGSASPRGRRAPGLRPRQRGQTTAEVAPLISFLVLVLLALVQVGLVIRARIMVTHAAREAVRAAVGGSDTDVRRAAQAAADLSLHRLEVIVRRHGPHANRIGMRSGT